MKKIIWSAIIAIHLIFYFGHWPVYADSADDSKAFDVAFSKSFTDGGMVVFLSDLHLTGDPSKNADKRFDAVVQKLAVLYAQNPKGVAQIVWMGDMIDSLGGPKDPAARLAIHQSAIERVNQALQIDYARDMSANLFVTGNHDETRSAAYENWKIQTLKIGGDALSTQGISKPDRKLDPSAYRAWEAQAIQIGSEQTGAQPEIIDLVALVAVHDIWKKFGTVLTERWEDDADVVLKGMTKKMRISHGLKMTGPQLEVAYASDRGKLKKEVSLLGPDYCCRVNGDTHRPQTIISPNADIILERGIKNGLPLSSTPSVFLSFETGTIGSDAKAEGVENSFTIFDPLRMQPYMMKINLGC